MLIASFAFTACPSVAEPHKGKTGGKKEGGGLLRRLWIFPSQTILSQCQVVGTGYFVWMKRCLGGMWGLVRKGTSGGGGWGYGGGGDNSHSIQIYGQDRGAPLDARSGDEESSTSWLQACQSKRLSEQLDAIL